MPFGGPAEWLVFAAADSNRLAEWLTKRKLAAWLKDGQLGPRPDNVNPIHEQTTFLNSLDLDALFADTGIRPYIIHQHQGDLVFIPAGCAHQVKDFNFI